MPLLGIVYFGFMLEWYPDRPHCGLLGVFEGLVGSLPDLFGPLGVLLGTSWVSLGRSWGVGPGAPMGSTRSEGTPWTYLGPCSGSLGPFGCLFEASEASFGPLFKLLSVYIRSV